MTLMELKRARVLLLLGRHPQWDHTQVRLDEEKSTLSVMNMRPALSVNAAIYFESLINLCWDLDAYKVDLRKTRTIAEYGYAAYSLTAIFDPQFAKPPKRKRKYFPRAKVAARNIVVTKFGSK